MDVFAHVAWTNVVFYKKLQKERLQRFIAVLFGVLPDIVSFIPSTIYLFFSKQDFYSVTAELTGASNWSLRYAVESYNYTHSLVIFLIFFVLITSIRIFRSTSKIGDSIKLMYIRKAIYWPLFGWLLHILIDIFTHKNFFETPFLFPLSGYKFSHGVSWAHPTFMLINYSVLVLVYLVWFFVFRKRRE